MRKIPLFTGIVAMVIGLGAVSTAGSAFAAGCVTNDLPQISLSHDSMVPEAGFGYDKDAYDAAAAQGNRCLNVQQGLHTKSGLRPGDADYTNMNNGYRPGLRHFDLK